MEIIGIDPAPAKGLHVCTKEGFAHYPLSTNTKQKTAAEFITEISQKTNTLICWDSPLTSPAAQRIQGSVLEQGDLTKRKIETFFNQTPPGISVQGYSGCPHWTISQYFLGLPVINTSFSSPDLPFKLAETVPRVHDQGPYVVEVHPAVAMWLWLTEDGLNSKDQSFKYKGSDKQPATLERMFDDLSQKPKIHKIWSAVPDFEHAKKSDDLFDALVAYTLGVLWVENSGAVIQLGNAETGSFLLPDTPGLTRKWSTFLLNGKSFTL